MNPHDENIIEKYTLGLHQPLMSGKLCSIELKEYSVFPFRPTRMLVNITQRGVVILTSIKTGPTDWLDGRLVIKSLDCTDSECFSRIATELDTLDSITPCEIRGIYTGVPFQVAPFRTYPLPRSAHLESTYPLPFIFCLTLTGMAPMAPISATH